MALRVYKVTRLLVGEFGGWENGRPNLKKSFYKDKKIIRM